MVNRKISIQILPRLPEFQVWPPLLLNRVMLLKVPNVCNAVEGHCLQVMNIVCRYANGCFDWLIYGQQSVDPSRETISILSGKCKRFTFVHPVSKNKREIFQCFDNGRSLLSNLLNGIFVDKSDTFMFNRSAS